MHSSYFPNTGSSSFVIYCCSCTRSLSVQQLLPRNSGQVESDVRLVGWRKEGGGEGGGGVRKSNSVHTRTYLREIWYERNVTSFTIRIRACGIFVVGFHGAVRGGSNCNVEGGARLVLIDGHGNGVFPNSIGTVADQVRPILQTTRYVKKKDFLVESEEGARTWLSVTFTTPSWPWKKFATSSACTSFQGYRGNEEDVFVGHNSTLT